MEQLIEQLKEAELIPNPYGEKPSRLTRRNVDFESKLLQPTVENWKSIQPMFSNPLRDLPDWDCKNK